MGRMSRLLLILLPFGMSGACDPAPPVSQPGTIPVKIWVVFGSSALETLGRPQNRGCRLTRAEISQYIDKLNAHATSLFGCNVKFVAPRDPDHPEQYVLNELHDPGVPSSGSRREQPATFIQNIILNESQQHTYHIFFTGHVSFPPDANGVADDAATIDPEQQSQHYFTYVNDRQRDDNGPGFRIDDHILEHEATHFLLRMDNHGPPYLPGGHVPAGSQNILVPLAPFQLIIPTAEQQEIAQRIRGNQAVP